MLRTNLSRAIRHLRRRRGWRQSDLAVAARVSRQVVSRIERGESLGSVPLRSVARLTEALDASVDVTVRWQGEELERLMDAAHAAIVETCVRLLNERAWQTRLEVSFNHYGDRGRVDVLAWQAGTGTLLVLEAKSSIGDVQETLGRLDVKVRLGAVLASTAGWARPTRVVPALVIGDSRRARRMLVAHNDLFARFDLRGRQALAWLRHPDGHATTGLLWFSKLTDSRAGSSRRFGRVRTVRKQP